MLLPQAISLERGLQHKKGPGPPCLVCAPCAHARNFYYFEGPFERKSVFRHTLIWFWAPGVLAFGGLATGSPILNMVPHVVHPWCSNRSVFGRWSLSLSIPLPIKASELNKDVEARVLTQHGQDWTSLSWANKKATFCPTKIWPGEHEGAVISYQIQRTMITLDWHLFICLGRVKLIENAIRPSQQCINQLLLAWSHAAPCEVENLWTQRRNNLEHKKSHSLVTFRAPQRRETAVAENQKKLGNQAGYERFWLAALKTTWGIASVKTQAFQNLVYFLHPKSILKLRALFTPKKYREL